MNQQLDNIINQLDCKFDLSFDQDPQKQPQQTSSIQQRPFNPQNLLKSNTSHDDKVELRAANQVQAQMQNVHQNCILPCQALLHSENVALQTSEKEKLYPQTPLSKTSNCHTVDCRNTYQSEKPINILQGDTAEHDEDDLISYQSLTQKFEVALSRLKYNSSQNNSQFAVRQQHYKKKKNSDLNQLKAEKQKRLAQVCTLKPLINSRSQQILTHYKPIQNRYGAVLDEKKRKLEQSMAQKKAKEAQQEQRMVQEIEQHQNSIKNKYGSQIRSEVEYYTNMKSWAETRDKKIEELATKKQAIQLQSSTFKPQINNKSQIIMKKKTERVPIYDKEPQPRKITIDANCTFKPNLNKTMKK